MRQQWLLAGAGPGAGGRCWRACGAFPACSRCCSWAWAGPGIERPEALSALATIGVDWRWPTFAWPAISAHDLLVGTVLLALPQAPLTLGNAIIGIRAENNRLFPHRGVSDRGVACPPAA